MSFYAFYAGSGGGGGGSVVTTVTATSPIFSSGGTTPNISIQVANAAQDGYLSSVDWNTFNNKGSGTVTSVAMSVPAFLSVAGSPITTSGTLAVTLSGTALPILNGGTAATTAITAFNNLSPITTKADLISSNGTNNVRLGVGTDGQVLSASSGQSTGLLWVTPTTGTVTSVALTLPASVFSVAGSPITSSGTLAGTFITQSANTVFAGPTSGGAATPAFRALVTADIPSLSGIYLPLAGGTMSGAINMGSNQIHSVTDPSSAQDAATKAYVDAGLAALNPATSVYAASTANLSGTYGNGAAGVGATFTSTANVPLSLDGVSVPVNSRVLIKNQTSGFQNGIYDVTNAGSGSTQYVLTRSADYNTPTNMNQAGLIPVINGSTFALSSWQQVAVITTIGTDSLVFQEFTANPSLYLLKANNLSDVASASTSFNNISPMTTGGDLIYGGASGAGTRLANGTSGQVLTSAGTTAAPTWQTPTTGTVTTVSVVSANGLAGTVATATTTPAITLSTTITGILQGNGTAISAATRGNLTAAGTDGITITTGTNAVLTAGTSIQQQRADVSHNGYLASSDWFTFNSKGTVTTVSVVTANGVSGSVATATTTPAITLTLGAITPTSVTAPIFSSNTANAASAGIIRLANTDLIDWRNAANSANISLQVDANNALNFSGGAGFVLNGSTSGAFTQKAAATTTGYTAIWPNAQGAASTFLQNDGSGNLSWVAGSSGTVTSVALTVPAFLSVAGSPITTNGTLAVSFSGSAIPIANGGTNATTATTAFNNLSPMTTGGDLIYGGASGAGTRLANGSAGQVLTSAGTTAAPTWATPTTGTVTSVALTMPAIFSVAGSPVTSSGTLAVTLATETANTVWAGPVSGGAATPTFRALTVADQTIAAQAISASAIDWSTGNVFTKTLGANTTFTFSNQVSGQTIVVRLTNTASNFTVTWPTVRWSGGAAPTMSPGAFSDVYTFINDGSNIYGSAVQNMS